MYSNSPDISPEATIVVRAQQIVNRWNRSKGGATFAAALSHEGSIHQEIRSSDSITIAWPCVR